MDTEVGDVAEKIALRVAVSAEGVQSFHALPELGVLLVGREASSGLPVPHPSVSRRHANLAIGAVLTIEDLGSSNGTAVNKVKIAPGKPTLVKPGDVIQIGDATLQIEATGRRPSSSSRETRRVAPRRDVAPPAWMEIGAADEKGVESAPAEVSSPAAVLPEAPPAALPEAPPADLPQPEPPTVWQPEPTASLPEPSPAAADLAPPPYAAASAPGDSSLDALLRSARDRKASDLHLVAGMPPLLRLNGQLERSGEALAPEDVDAIVRNICAPDQLELFEKTGDVDFCHLVGEERYRTNICRHRSGTAVTFRVIKERIPTLKELGLPPQVEKLVSFAQGLVLVTGPLGAGKTTSLFSLVELINQSRPHHIITIEDPIEFRLAPAKCQISQRELGAHTRSFGAALRGALRENPDVIVVGDLRDHETASLAISAAETGHLVLASMPSMNAMKTLDKLLDMFPSGEQASVRTMVSESLRGILCQKLLPGLGGTQVLAVELLFNSIGIGNMIRENKLSGLQNAMQTGKNVGMKTFDMSASELLKAKLISAATARIAK